MAEAPQNFSMNPEQIAQMQNQQDNPLRQYMRQPSIYIKLPSNGQYWMPGTLEQTQTGEFPVLPMSTRDEIMLNTPDALLNGEAVVSMIQSCVPNIKNAWSIPSIDLDTILIGIRIASYGESMEYVSTCPSCENQDNYEIDLRQFLDMPVDIVAYQQPFEYKGIQVYLRPLDYNSVNNQNLEQFEQQRLIQMVNDSSISEADKQQRFTQMFNLLTDYTITNVVGSISKLVTPDGLTVIDEAQIRDFVTNSERLFFAKVKEHLESIRSQFPEKKVTTVCDSCSHNYETPFTFDQSNFFAFAS